MTRQPDKPAVQAIAEDEGPKEECAVFGIYGSDDASAHALSLIHI